MLLCKDSIFERIMANSVGLIRYEESYRIVAYFKEVLNGYERYSFIKSFMKG